MADTVFDSDMPDGVEKDSESSPSLDTSSRNADFTKASVTLVDAMANKSRLIVLSRLVKDEMSVGELCKLVGISQSALSQHLAKLRSAGLVKTRRSAQNVYYSCNSPAVVTILKELAEYFPQP